MAPRSGTTSLSGENILGRVLGSAEETLDPKVLLDPFEEKFHMPAVTIEGGDRQRGNDKIIGQKNEAPVHFLGVESHSP